MFCLGGSYQTIDLTDRARYEIAISRVNDLVCFKTCVEMFHPRKRLQLCVTIIVFQPEIIDKSQ